MMMFDQEGSIGLTARLPNFVSEPEVYYERFGLYIPNVIFPTGNVVVNGILFLYYGVCDTAIARPTMEMDVLVD
jgi:predicted GH43/DUF377 family glycosyl hydrolase